MMKIIILQVISFVFVISSCTNIENGDEDDLAIYKPYTCKSIPDNWGHLTINEVDSFLLIDHKICRSFLWSNFSIFFNSMIEEYVESTQLDREKLIYNNLVSINCNELIYEEIYDDIVLLKKRYILDERKYNEFHFILRAIFRNNNDSTRKLKKLFLK